MGREPGRQLLDLLRNLLGQRLLGFALLALFCLAAAPPAPIYRPRKGETATVRTIDRRTQRPRMTIACVGDAAYEEYWKALTADDADAVEDLETTGALVRLMPGARVLVLEIKPYEREDPRPDVAVARVLDGPYEGKQVYVATFDVKPLATTVTPKEKPRSKMTPREEMEYLEAKTKAYYDRPVEERRAIEEGARQLDAQTNLNIAEQLRKAGKATEARKYYEQVVREASDLPEAATARARLKAMTQGVKVPEK